MLRKIIITAIAAATLAATPAKPTRSALGGAGTNRSAEQTLPYDAEVEYLQSTGTQYIIFDEIINGFEGVLLPENNNAYGAVGNWNGGSQANAIKWAYVQNRGWIVTSQASGSYVYSGNLNRDMLLVTVRGTAVTIGGSSYTLREGWSSQPKFMLFGCVSWGSSVSQANTPSPQASTIGACKLYFNNTLLRDLQPVRKDGVGYMYDRVSGQLFGNSGTGAFVMGPDKIR